MDEHYDRPLQNEPKADTNGASAGSFWQDPLAIALSNTPKDIISPRSRTRAVTVVYILIDEADLPQSEENLSLRCLEEACADAHAKMNTIPFGSLALGTTDILDIFYNAGKYWLDLFTSRRCLKVFTARCPNLSKGFR